MPIRALSLAAALLLPACTSGLRDQAPLTPGIARFDWFSYEGADPSDHAFPAGAGEYRNPILKGFYPDPSITSVGNDHYLVTSTFSYFPGIPVFHSRDLVSWTQIGNAIDRPGQLDFGRLGMSRGVFAPSIEEHRGTFYILNTCVDCGGNFVITARNPAGPWSDPIWLPEIEGGIDPSLFFDEDGKAWVLNNGPPEGQPLYEGHRAIWIQEFDPSARKMIGPRTMLVNGGVDISQKPIWIEGPHIIRKDGWYYLIAAEGGTAEGHSQVVLRSRSVTGPYAAYPGNPILTQRDLPRDRPFPITSAGHADLVETSNGEWWATFLAVRPYAGDFYNTGRETFLLPVSWEGGWPRITGPGDAIPYVHPRPKLPPQPAPAVPTTGAFTVREEFDAPVLPPHWLMMRNPAQSWHQLHAGSLWLRARPVGLGDMGNPSFLGRRQQHSHASASTLVHYVPAREGDEAGLAAIQNDDFWYLLAISRDASGPVLKLRRRAGAQEDPAGAILASVPLDLPPGAPLYLKIVARGAEYDFLYATQPERWLPMRRGEDGTILSTKAAGGFVGALFGVHARSTTAPHDNAKQGTVHADK